MYYTATCRRIRSVCGTYGPPVSGAYRAVASLLAGREFEASSLLAHFLSFYLHAIVTTDLWVHPWWHAWFGMCVSCGMQATPPGAGEGWLRQLPAPRHTCVAPPVVIGRPCW